MYSNRIDMYRALEAARGSRVLVYITGDRPNLGAHIHMEVLDFFVNHLDTMQDARTITLILYTRGGETLAAWSIANLIRQFCDQLEVVIPFKCHSAGTLLSLAADRIIMTKQASLGPIDPSVNTPLNPGIPGAPPQHKMPVSVEDINGYVDFARSIIGTGGDLTSALNLLAQNVHPLVLGSAYRARSQIRMLAGKLLSNHRDSVEQEQVDKLLDFLCSDSGSHDYTISREEARNDLGLPIEKPNADLYRIIKNIYTDFATELELTLPFDPKSILGAADSIDYRFPQALIESTTGGQHMFLTEGQLRKKIIPTPHQMLPPGMQQQIMPPQAPQQTMIEDERRFQGWRHSNV